MSEESRLGRERLETEWNLKQLIDAGVRVFYYLGDRETKIDDATNSMLEAFRLYASQMEREKGRQRTHDALLRKARTGHVPGGAVYGYRNVEVHGPNGTRSHVVREIAPEQATVLVRLFRWYAEGLGLRTIAARLNAEGAPAPRAHGWAPTAIREMLRREDYRGVVTWNRTERIIRKGTEKQRPRPEAEWVQTDAPHLRIIPDDLWAAVQARLHANETHYTRSARGGLKGGAVRRGDDESPYLLTGLATCATCGGPMGTVTRMHGTGGHRLPARFYGCTTRIRRGDTACTNRSLIRHERLDARLLDTLRAILEDEEIMDRALAEDDARRRAAAPDAPRQRAVNERRLAVLAKQITNLVDAIAAAGPVEDLVARLKSHKAEQAALLGEQERLAALVKPSAPRGTDTHRLCASAAAFARTLSGEIARVRQGLALLLAGKITLAPVGRRAYRFKGRLRLGVALFGDARETRHAVVAPTGFATLCTALPIRGAVYQRAA
jgi:site-specific DNA recombinase